MASLIAAAIVWTISCWDESVKPSTTCVELEGIQVDCSWVSGGKWIEVVRVESESSPSVTSAGCFKFTDLQDRSVVYCPRDRACRLEKGKWRD